MTKRNVEKQELLDAQLTGVGRKTVSPVKTIGAPGTAIFGGYIQENERSPKLSGREKYKTYSDMVANTTIVAAGVRYFLNLVSKAQWRVVPNPDAEDRVKAEEMATRIRRMMDNTETPWHRIVRRAAMYRFYGFSLQEWTAKRDEEDGALVIWDIEPRAQITIEKWDVDIHGRVLGVVQQSPQTSEELYLPRGKLVYMVDDAINDSPEGLGLFRHLAETVVQLVRFVQLEGFGFESDLRGVPIGRAPIKLLDELIEDGEITEADKMQYLQPIQDFMKSHVKSPALGILFDSSTYRGEGENAAVSGIHEWDVELMRSDNVTSQEAIARAIDRKNREIARVLGVEGLLLGDGDRGSEALSRDKSHNFSLIVDSTLDELAEGFEKDVIGTVFKLNGWDEKLKPSLTPEAIQFRDIDQITSAIKDIAAGGAPLNITDKAVKEVYELLGLTPPSIENAENDLTLTNDEEDGSMEDGTEDEDTEMETDDGE